MKVAILACLLIVSALTVVAAQNGFDANQALSAKAPDYDGPN